MWLDRMTFIITAPWAWQDGNEGRGSREEKVIPYWLGSPLYQALVRPIHDWAMTLLARC